MAKFLDFTGLGSFKEKMQTWAKGLFVEKQEGKGLSTNDYTTNEKQKLASLTPTKIDGVKVNGQALVPDGTKNVNIDLTKYATKDEMSNVYKYKGSKSTYAELPTQGNKVGDVYNIETADPTHDILAGDNVAWEGTKWDKLGGTFTIDTSGFATKKELTNLDNKKVDKVDGKGLSTNDYTNEEKAKLEGLKNYTHPTTDGNKHVPANGTTNAGKVLTAGAVAGVYTWETPQEVEAITEEEINNLFNK